jgi:hypothetical protein
MSNTMRLTAGLLLLSALVLGIAPASATAGFTNPRGILTALNADDLTIYFGGGSQSQSYELALAIMPPWYFVSDLHKFDTLTLSMKVVTLRGITLHWRQETSEYAPKLLQDTIQWTNIVIDQDGDGGFTGNVLYATITLVTDANTQPGFYLLYLNAQATAGDTVFKGFDQLGIDVRLSGSSCGEMDCLSLPLPPPGPYLP